MVIAVLLESLCGAQAIGLPVAFALIMCGLALMLRLGIFDAQIVAARLIEGADNVQLLAVPSFMLAEEPMDAGGLSRRIVAFATSLVGHVNGGLPCVAIMAAILLALLSRSAAADTAALASVLIPMMRQAAYPLPKSAGLIAA